MYLWTSILTILIDGLDQAERELSKQKNLVMLQAAVRGHLVRKHAVGSLRCVQAIIKLQILVRARHTRYSPVEFIDEEKPHVKRGNDNRTQKVRVSSQIDFRILLTPFCQAIKLGTGFHCHNGIIVNIFFFFSLTIMNSKLLVSDL